MLLYLFSDSLLSTWQKKIETAKWPKAADSPLLPYYPFETSDAEVAGTVAHIYIYKLLLLY